VVQVLSSDPGYYNWICQGQFPLSTKKVLTQIKFAMINRGH
jgi:DNA polymerase-3 subunit epsilon